MEKYEKLITLDCELQDIYLTVHKDGTAEEAVDATQTWRGNSNIVACVMTPMEAVSLGEKLIELGANTNTYDHDPAIPVAVSEIIDYV